MSRFSLICAGLAMVGTIAGCSSAGMQEQDSAQANQSPQHKNVLFVLVDDLGIKDLGVEGSSFYETPNIDALAQKGVRFTQGYAASQVCSPSRASLLTGKYVTNHGITTWIGDKYGAAWRARGRFDSHDPANYKHVLEHSEVTIAEQFQNNGYDTFFAGKWHLGDVGSHPEDHGFNTNVAGWDTGTPKGGYFSPYANPKLKDGPDGESLTLRLAQETAAYIQRQQGDKPFFAYLSFYAVHAPIQSTKALWEKYRDKAEQQNLAATQARFEFDRRGAVRQIQDNPIFAGLVESMDTAVGVVLQALKAKGLDKNTIVVFTSDNGGLATGDGHGTSSLPYRGGKGSQFEGGIRVPYYIYAPGMAANGSDVAVPVSGIDLYPTLLDLAGIQPNSEHKLDGISLKPLLNGKQTAERPLFWHFPHYGNHGGEPSSIIRQGDWKLIYYHEDQRIELYNLVNDIGEQNDLSATQTAQAQRLNTLLQGWLKATNAQFPTPNSEYDPAKRKARFEKIKHKTMPKLDKKHDSYLDKDYSPQNKWWGSEVGSNLIYLDTQRLNKAKQAIAEKQPKYLAAYKSLIQQADKELSKAVDPVTNKTLVAASGDIHDYHTIGSYYHPDETKANGLPWVYKDGVFNKDSAGSATDWARRKAMLKSLNTLNLAYVYSEDTKYLNKAKEIVHTWFVNPATKMNPNVDYGKAIPGKADGTNFAVIDWTDIGKVVTTVQLINQNKLWNQADKSAMDKWFNDYYIWLTTSEFGLLEDTRSNNHGTNYDYQAIGLMIYLGKTLAAKAKIEAAKTTRVAAQIAADGSQPLELARTKSVNYTVNNLWALARIADLASRHINVDLWSYRSEEGASLQKGFEFVVPYMTGEKTWQWRQITGGGAKAQLNKLALPMFSRAELSLGKNILPEELDGTDKFSVEEVLTYAP